MNHLSNQTNPLSKPQTFTLKKNDTADGQPSETKRLLAVLGLLLIFFSLPLAVVLVRQRQEIRKAADTPAATPTPCPEYTGVCGGRLRDNNETCALAGYCAGDQKPVGRACGISGDWFNCSEYRCVFPTPPCPTPTPIPLECCCDNTDCNSGCGWILSGTCAFPALRSPCEEEDCQNIPTATPAPLSCNSQCSTTAQCQAVNPNWVCVDTVNSPTNVCRHQNCLLEVDCDCTCQFYVGVCGGKLKKNDNTCDETVNCPSYQRPVGEACGNKDQGWYNCSNYRCVTYPECGPTPTPTPIGGPPGGATNTPVPTSSPGTTPTSGPGPTSPPTVCGCTSLGLYNPSNQRINPTSLNPGDTVRIFVNGGGGTFWRGRIRVNENTWATRHETTNFQAGLGYFVEYTLPTNIPATGQTFVVEGEICCGASAQTCLWR